MFIIHVYYRGTAVILVPRHNIIVTQWSRYENKKPNTLPQREYTSYYYTPTIPPHRLVQRFISSPYVVTFNC